RLHPSTVGRPAPSAAPHGAACGGVGARDSGPIALDAVVLPSLTRAINDLRRNPQGRDANHDETFTARILTEFIESIRSCYSRWIHVRVAYNRVLRGHNVSADSFRRQRACRVGDRSKTIMEFRVLGPTELWSDGEQYDLGPARERSALAILLLTPRTIVPAETLIDRLWGNQPPPKARESLSVYMTRLRTS